MYFEFPWPLISFNNPQIYVYNWLYTSPALHWVLNHETITCQWIANLNGNPLCNLWAPLPQPDAGMFDWATEVACYNRLKNHVVVVDFSIQSATLKQKKKLRTQFLHKIFHKIQIRKNLFQNHIISPAILLRPLRCEAARCAPETRPNTCPAEMIYVECWYLTNVDTHNQLNIQTFNLMLIHIMNGFGNMMFHVWKMECATVSKFSKMA